ncbi:DMT family transporter [Aquisalimonas sp.]|uniref:DMT family transporter n=1 Tax=Aquisalimonas sp. TaxID=1872621 RepID=UPI0025B904D0|nr:DMT family transporter [Aquisalimonas sp.]
MAVSAATQGLWIRAMPILFVLLWSTGFIGARFGLPYAEPFTFLTIRFLCTLVVLYLIIRVMREVWPRTLKAWLHIGVAGVLVHAAYLGGVFSAIDQGMPAGVTALIVGLQPLVTAALARSWLGERINRNQWIGIILGLAGITLVLGEQLDLADPATLFTGFGSVALLAAALALLGISIGTLYQKRYCTEMPLTTGTFIQFVGASLVLGLAALVFETREIEWTLTFVLTLGWLIFGLSIAAILLLMALIRRGEASRVASLFYLVPPVTAVEAWILFGERLGPMALTGIAVAVFGVAMAVRQPTAGKQ